MYGSARMDGRVTLGCVRVQLLHGRVAAIRANARVTLGSVTQIGAANWRLTAAGAVVATGPPSARGAGLDRMKAQWWIRMQPMAMRMIGCRASVGSMPRDTEFCH